MAKYCVTYYKYGYKEQDVVIPYDDSDDPVIDEKIKEAIEKALGTINLKDNGDNTYTLDIDGRDAGEITIPEDKYLTDVETDEENKEVNFKVSNGQDIRVPLDKLDEQDIDLSTY